jgi:hypothetical protein
MFDWGSSEVPILFPSHIGHDEIASMVHRTSPGISPISAGFVSHNKECYGESVTMKLKSRKIDTQIIKLLFKNEYE